MATNGPNGNTPNGNINFNSNPSVQPGITGYFQGQSTRREFTNDFWKEGGYLSESIKELEEMKRQYKEMSKEVSNLSKSEQKTFRDRKQALNQQLALLKTIRENQEASDTEAIEAINSSNKLRLKGQQDLIKLLNSIIENQDKADQQHLDNLDAAVEKYNQIKQTTDETGQKLKQTTNILSKSSDSFSDSLSKTLNTAGDKLRDLSNMFSLSNLSSIANQFDAKNRSTLIGTVNRQFGFTGTNDFNTFKNSLISELEDMNSSMGNLFNSDDLKTYMSKLDDYGITSTEVAQSQLRSSLIATKYLAASDETMTKMFKYMKMSNNNSLIEDYNKSTIAIMKSQLGVSEKQLDELRNANLDVGTAIQQLGGTLGDEFMLDLEKVQASLMNNGYSQYAVEGITKELARVLEEGYSSGYDAQTMNKLNAAFQSGDAWAAVQALFDSNQSKQSYSTMTSTGNLFYNTEIKKSLQNNGILSENMLGAYSTNANNPNALNNAYQDYLNTKETESNLTTDDVEQAIADSQPLGWIQQWMNSLSLEFDKLPWGSYIALADAAFAMYIGSGIVKFVTTAGHFIKNIPGKLTSLFSTFLGKGSAIATNTANTASGLSGMSSSLVATGGGILISAVALAAINAAIQSANAASEEYGAERAENDLAGTKYEDNATMNSLYASAHTIADRGGLQNAWNNMTSGIGYGASSIFQGADEKNKNLTQWIMSSDTLGSDEATIIQRIAAWGLMMDAAGHFNAFKEGMSEAGANDWSAATAKELANILIEQGWSNDRLNETANSIINAGYKPYYNNDSRMESANLSLDGYKMNGIDWVPKDNYRALLHKGEMVLTADEAKAYRSMLMPKNVGGVREGFYSVDDGRRGGNYPYPITSAWNEARDGGRHHTGVDFGMSQGTPIGASIPGKVASASYNGGYGNLVVVQANNGKYMLYAHQSRMAVKAGQQVNAGTLIGYVGSTGNSTGPHLHFEVRKTSDYGTDIDPLPYVTNSLFNIGDTSGTALSSSTDNFNDAQESDGSVQVRTRRFVPKAFTGNMGGDDGPGRIVNSVDGGFNKLISYLDSIRDEQVKQRALLNAFSKSRIPESTF